MNTEKWLLYGANGYTGKLIAKEAIARGHTPTLAGRSEMKLIPMAKEMGLDYIIFDLNDNNIDKIVSDYDLVFHSAGPYIHTSAPMVKACLKAGTNYLDITGEIPVLEQHFKLDIQARQKEMAIIPGAGFDVIPTDCVAKQLSEKISDATQLEIAIALCTEVGCVSPGTLKTVFEYIAPNMLVRREGKLTKIPLGSGSKEVQFSDINRKVAPTIWADLVTAYVSTGIPNITVYAPHSKSIVNMMKETKFKKDKVDEWINENVHGPSEETQQTERSHIWAKVANDNGDEAQLWLETMEAYRFTAIAAIRSVEKVFELAPKGALTPSLAFGSNFVLEIPETRLLVSL